MMRFILLMFFVLPVFAAKTLPELTETTDPGVGSVMWIVDPNLSDPKDRKITVPNLRTEMGLTTVGAAETLWGVNVIVSTEIDSIAEIETLTGVNIIVSTEIDTIGEIETLAAGVNILLETEIDASAELKALMDDETGTGGALVFAAGPSLSDVVITGSVNLPNGAAPTTDATGEVALDTTITDHKSLIQYDGGADEMLVIAIPRANLDTTDGDVIKYDAATDAFIMAPDNNSGSSTALNDIGDATADGTIAIGAHEIDFTSTIDASGEAAFTITNTDASSANDNSLIDLRRNDTADANSFYLRMIGDNDGTPVNDYLFSQTGFISTPPITVGSAAGVSITGDNGTVTFLGTGDGQDEDMKVDLNGTANTAVWTSTTSMATWDFGTSWVFKLGTIELGHATDTTISRNAAGFASVENKPIASPASAVAGDVMYFDGTQWVRLAKGTAGQVLEMNAGATAPEWDTDDNAGSNTTFDAIGDSAADGSVTIGHTNIWTFSLDGSRFLQMLASDVDNASDTTLLTLAFNDAADANSIAIDVISDADGTPASVFKLSATALTTSVAITPTGAIDAGGATSLEIPNGNDPDLTVEGQLSYDANGDYVRGFDGTVQVALGRKFETYQATIIAPNDLADAQRDAFFFFSNNSGMSFIITEWLAWSTSDDTDLNIETTANDGSGNATVDAVTIATNGTGIFTGTDATITAATIANGSVVWLDFDDTDTPAMVHITIKGYYAADVN